MDHHIGVLQAKGQVMDFKETIYKALEGHGVKYIDVDRDANVNGLDATLIKVYATDREQAHEFSFAKANHMDAEHMATVIKSYLRNRT